MTGFYCLNMKLVKLNNFKLEVEDELLLLKPFKELYKADKTKDKSKFMELLTIIYFTYDPRSDYDYIADEEERLKEVCETNGFDIPKFTSKETECINLYKKLNTTTSSLLLEDTKAAIENVRKMLRSIDFNVLEEKDKVTALKNITSMTSMIPKLVKDLSEAEKTVQKELEEAGRVRGSVTKTIFEDGVTI